ncbi:iron complex transport system substrate-binding protein [Comamonas sp. BIGb0152]|uniref:ABC transporter substrate-binding protein n=1 Tax=Comamonas sp. BIGb0152 TaxID=2940601 RepID=UPI002169B176|nr:ABC transporter substrate-binding protein [Comamonas sp. BIGb0152]MCS4291879.1 iron complex transport system substrate-binding protein [Comamonas sp. BIGb0152]
MAFSLIPASILRKAQAWAGIAGMALAVGLPLAHAAPSASVDELRLQPFAHAPVWKDQDLVAPAGIVDDRGRKVQLDKPPQRIVSLLPSLTESTCALGLCERLVGVDRYSDWPASVKKLPIVGGGLDPSVESVVALKPDVVLLSDASKAAERLQALGLKVVALDVKSKADIHRVLGTLGRLLGVPQAQGADRVWRDLESGIDAVVRGLPERTRHTRVYFEVSRGPYAAGPQSFIGETLTQLGVDNVVPAELGPFPRLSPEFLLRAQPDVIMLGNRSMQAATSYPGWNNLQAVKAGRVCVFTDEESFAIVRPGPRMAQAAALMARCLADKAPGKAAVAR